MITTTPSVEAFVERITAGLTAWEDAGAILVALIDNRGMSLETIAATANSEVITIDLLERFERIGRKQALPRLLVANFPAARHLLRMPYSEQCRLMEEPVELLLLKDGKPDVLKVGIRNLTTAQCHQVFGADSVKAIPAQRAWLEEKAQAMSLPAAGGAKYRITRSNTVVFAAGAEFTVKELAAILSAAS